MTYSSSNPHKHFLARFSHFQVGLVIIGLFALVLRFYNYFVRLNLGPDQGRDALIGLEALSTGHFLLLGPPSSAWGFNFGPLYYHLISLFHFLLPGALAPWLGFTLLSVACVLLIYHLAFRMGGLGFAIIAGILSAFNIASLGNSGNLLNTVLAMYAGYFTLYFLYFSLNSTYLRYSLLFGLSLGLAINSHLQALFLLSFIPLVFAYRLYSHTRPFKHLLMSMLGLAFTMIPLLVFELQHNWAWSKSLIDYSLVGQHQFYVPVRWLTEIFVFWPQLFGQVTTGVVLLGYPLVGLVLVSIFLSLYTRKLPPVIGLILICLILEVINIRYYKGPRSSEYFLTLVPLFDLLFSWSVWTLYRQFRYLGIALLLVISVFLLPQLWSVIHPETNSRSIMLLASQVSEPTVNLSLTAKSEVGGHTLAYFLHYSRRLKSSGIPLTFCSSNTEDSICDQSPVYSQGPFGLVSGQSTISSRFDPAIFIPRTYNNYQLQKY